MQLAQTAKGGLPTQLRAFTTILFVIILIVMVVMNIRSSRIAKTFLSKKEATKNVQD